MTSEPAPSERDRRIVTIMCVSDILGSTSGPAPLVSGFVETALAAIEPAICHGRHEVLGQRIVERGSHRWARLGL
jgi:hypothetical protein